MHIAHCTAYQSDSAASGARLVQRLCMGPRVPRVLFPNKAKAVSFDGDISVSTQTRLLVVLELQNYLRRTHLPLVRELVWPVECSSTRRVSDSIPSRMQFERIE